MIPPGVGRAVLQVAAVLGGSFTQATVECVWHAVQDDPADVATVIQRGIKAGLLKFRAPPSCRLL